MSALALLFYSLLAYGNDFSALETAIRSRNAAIAGLKPGNETRLELESGSRTPTSFVYLHGFSASPKEASPLTESLAEERKANAYFPLYRGHGIEGSDGLRGVTLADWERETREALDNGRLLGNKVVVVALSTGASLALPAVLENSEQIAALVLIAPNFRLHRWDSELLRLPFGGWLARLFLGEYREWKPKVEAQRDFWTTRYPAEVVVEVAKAAASARHAPLEDLKVPAFVAYSERDTVVHLPALKDAFARLGSPKKELYPAERETLDGHVIAGDILAKEFTPVLQKRISAFLRGLGL